MTRRSAIGRRDLAILTLLARLDLRAGEIAALGLDDIDWLAGEISINGNGGRRDRLPGDGNGPRVYRNWMRCAVP